MRSSRSTPSRSPEREIPLYLLLAGEDHPRACTGRRLVRSRLVRALTERSAWPLGLLLLDPHAPVPLSRHDRAKAAPGVLAVDCSWNRLEQRGGYPGDVERLERLRLRRRLPWLLAGNAQHFGKLGELNTAEALAAALFVLGWEPRARNLMEAAGRGDSFLTLNREALQSFQAAPDAAAIEEAEKLYY